MLKDGASRIDRIYLIITLIILCIGFVIQYSASSSLAVARFNDPGYFMKGHFIRIVIGLVFGLFFTIIDYHKLRGIASVIAIASAALLVYTIIYNRNHEIGVAARWLPIGPFKLQTSEFAKMSIIIYLASFLSRRQPDINSFKKMFLKPLIILFILTALIVIQPDFSTGAVIALIGIAILWFGGLKSLYAFSVLGVGGILSIIALSTSEYRVQRLTHFLDPDLDLQGKGYQIYQSLISLGNGGLIGRGLGNSVEKDLFLPNPHTDFIFAIIGEEFGFIGASIVLALFLVLFIRGLWISLQAPDPLGNLLGVGLSISIFSYVIINAGVACRIFPVTGLPLPFISYGGSSMIYNLSATGIILNISKQRIPKDNSLKTITVYD